MLAREVHSFKLTNTFQFGFMIGCHVTAQRRLITLIQKRATQFVYTVPIPHKEDVALSYQSNGSVLPSPRDDS